MGRKREKWREVERKGDLSPLDLRAPLFFSVQARKRALRAEERDFGNYFVK